MPDFSITSSFLLNNLLCSSCLYFSYSFSFLSHFFSYHPLLSLKCLCVLKHLVWVTVVCWLRATCKEINTEHKGGTWKVSLCLISKLPLASSKASHSQPSQISKPDFFKLSDVPSNQGQEASRWVATAPDLLCSIYHIAPKSQIFRVSVQPEVRQSLSNRSSPWHEVQSADLWKRCCD